MNDERLRNLLNRADDDMPSGPQLNGDRIRRLAQSRRRRRRAVGLGLIVIVISASLLVRTGKKTPAPQQPADTMDVQAMVDLQAQEELDHRHVLDWLARTHPTPPAEARDQAAWTIVLVAPSRAELADTKEAALMYERAAALFPETQGAAAAHQALAKMNHVE